MKDQEAHRRISDRPLQPGQQLPPNGLSAILLNAIESFVGDERLQLAALRIRGSGDIEHDYAANTRAPDLIRGLPHTTFNL
jgi:hypothetical protein